MKRVKFEKIIELKGEFEKIIQIVSDIRNTDKLLSPFNLENKIKEISNQKVTVIEKIIFPFIRKMILQESIYEFIKPNETKIQIMSGPFKGTKIHLKYKQVNSLTQVILSGELKINYKYSFFQPLIKNRFLKNITSIVIRIDRLSILTIGKTWKDSISDDGDAITIMYKTIPIKLYGWYKSAFTEIFFDESYSLLPVNGKTVVDIGANIGDSAIYFAIKGAKRIIAVEPFPKNFEIAKKNISLNNLIEKIDLILGAITKEEEEINVDPNYVGTDPGTTYVKHGSSIINVKDGIQISTFTLENLIDVKKIDDAILKVDCEGCEYDIVLNSGKKILRKFSHIIIEFHKGYIDLKECLEKCGFFVRIKKSKRQIGFLYAERK